MSTSLKYSNSSQLITPRSAYLFIVVILALLKIYVGIVQKVEIDSVLEYSSKTKNVSECFHLVGISTRYLELLSTGKIFFMIHSAEMIFVLIFAIFANYAKPKDRFWEMNIFLFFVFHLFQGYSLFYSLFRNQQNSLTTIFDVLLGNRTCNGFFEKSTQSLLISFELFIIDFAISCSGLIFAFFMGLFTAMVESTEKDDFETNVEKENLFAQVA